MIYAALQEIIKIKERTNFRTCDRINIIVKNPSSSSLISIGYDRDQLIQNLVKKLIAKISQILITKEEPDLIDSIFNIHIIAMA